MELFHLYTSPIQTNTYIVINGDRGFVVDPGGNAHEIIDIFNKKQAMIDGILLTHAHFDHIGGVAELLQLASENGKGDTFNTPLVVMHKSDVDKIGSYKNMGFSMGIKTDKFEPDILVNDGEKLKIANLDVKVVYTPGHSKGGVCYIVDNKIFVGDTIFFMSYGRTDFYDGDFLQLKNSIVNKLFRLQGNYTLLPGHGEPTTLAFEKANNPILTDDVIK